MYLRTARWCPQLKTAVVHQAKKAILSLQMWRQYSRMKVFPAPAAVQIRSWPAYGGQIEDLGGGAQQSIIGSSPHPEL